MTAAAEILEGAATFLQAQEYEAQGGALAHANLSLAVRARGPLDLNAAQAAVNQLVAKHEILRSSLTRRNGEVAQLIHPAVPLPLVLLRLDDVPASGRASAWRRFVKQIVFEPFRLGSHPWIRCAIIRLDPTEHVLCFAMPHTVCDLAGLASFLSQFAEVYQLGEGRGGQLCWCGEAPLQVADVAHWERTVANKQSEAYWRMALRGASGRVALPLDRASAATYGFFRVFAPIPPVPSALISRLSEIARQAGGTPACALVAGLATLLGSGAVQEVVIGLMFANRDRAEFSNVVGCLHDVVPFRLQVPDRRRFSELLQEAIARQRELHSYRLPGARLLKMLEQPCDVLLNIRWRPAEFTAPVLKDRQLTLTAMDLGRGEPVFPARSDWWGSQLTVSLDHSDGTPLRGDIGYNAAALSRQWTTAFALALARILGYAALTPGRSLGELRKRARGS